MTMVDFLFWGGLATGGGWWALRHLRQQATPRLRPWPAVPPLPTGDPPPTDATAGLLVEIREMWAQK